MRKSFSGNAVATTLGGGISPTAMILNVGATTGWPDTTVGPFVITVDRGQGSLEEKMLISSFSGATLTVETRGWDGTTAQSHSSGASVVHTLDADTINTHDDVVAGVGSVTPSTSAVGDSAADGSSIFPAAADHKHARESFATGATAASAPGDSRNDGSSVSPARADHKHARESVASLVSDVSPSILGLPLGLTGATAPTRYVGATTSGHPTSGTFAQGDFSIDQSGVVWICTAPGTPGTWVNPATNPAGSIFLTANQNVSTLAQLVTFTTEFVTGGVTAPGSSLVVPTSDKYRISWAAFFSTTGANNSLECNLFKNGSVAVTVGGFTTATGQIITLGASKVLACTAGDSFTLEAQSPTNFSTVFGAASTFLSVERATS